MYTELYITPAEVGHSVVMSVIINRPICEAVQCKSAEAFKIKSCTVHFIGTVLILKPFSPQNSMSNSSTG